MSWNFKIGSEDSQEIANPLMSPPHLLSFNFQVRRRTDEVVVIGGSRFFGPVAEIYLVDAGPISAIIIGSGSLKC